MTRTSTAALLTAVALAVPLAAAPSAVADGSAAAQQRYVGALVVAHRDATAYSQMEDYADTLEYWHEHPDWGLGS